MVGPFKERLILFHLAFLAPLFTPPLPRVFHSMKRLLGRTYEEAHQIGLRPSELGADPSGQVGACPIDFNGYERM